MSAAGPFRGRLHERGEAKARRARPRVRAAADMGLRGRCRERKEPHGIAPPLGTANAVSVGVHQRRRLPVNQA